MQDVNTRGFDLITFARKNRYRIRNLHDGGMVPPARHTKPKGDLPTAQVGFIGRDDRCDVIVGYDGYILDEGNGRLGVYLCYKSSRGVKRAQDRIGALAGSVTQVGDTEIVGNVPVSRIKDAVKLIRVSKLAMRNPNPTFGHHLGERTRARIA